MSSILLSESSAGTVDVILSKPRRSFPWRCGAWPPIQHFASFILTSNCFIHRSIHPDGPHLRWLIHFNNQTLLNWFVIDGCTFVTKQIHVRLVGNSSSAGFFGFIFRLDSHPVRMCDRWSGREAEVKGHVLFGPSPLVTLWNNMLRINPESADFPSLS